MMHDFRILFVDDNADVLEVFKDIFEFMEFDVVTAASGVEAIQRVHESHFDVVMLDLMMPHMNGAVTMEAIKRIDKEAKFGVITAYVTSDLAKKVKEQGVLRIFSKPVVPDELVGFMAKLSDEKKERQRLENAPEPRAH